jgi:hypothetical protein
MIVFVPKVYDYEYISLVPFRTISLGLVSKHEPFSAMDLRVEEYGLPNNFLLAFTWGVVKGPTMTRCFTKD